jgi:hypothetical protein
LVAIGLRKKPLLVLRKQEHIASHIASEKATEMGKRKVNSDTRARVLKMMDNRVGELTKEIQKKVGNSQFQIRKDLVADDRAFKSLAHCKPSTRFLYISTVVSELQHRGLIKRNGKAFYFAKPVKGKKNVEQQEG